MDNGQKGTEGYRISKKARNQTFLHHKSKDKVGFRAVLFQKNLGEMLSVIKLFSYFCTKIKA